MTLVTARNQLMRAMLIYMQTKDMTVNIVGQRAEPKV
jgi:hypothetical protein